jgi:bifunctional DNA-binding transcriptional regulator/antitoxin component of YhaV-PrlF toxin-antitoxin module
MEQQNRDDSSNAGGDNRPGRVHVTRIDSDGSISIPDEWMQELGWQVGDELAFKADGDVIVITKAVPVSPGNE